MSHSDDIPSSIRQANPLSILGTHNTSGDNPLDASSASGNAETLGKFKRGSSRRSGYGGMVTVGTCKLLIATDVVSEGLDVPSCNLVVLYNMPSANEINQKQKQVSTD